MGELIGRDIDFGSLIGSLVEDYGLYVLIGLVCYVVFAVLLWGFTWLVYLAGMATIHAEPRLVDNFGARRVANVVARAGPIMSTSLNWLVFTFILLEFPKEYYLSARLSRHYRHGKGWRQKLSAWMGRIWLDPFDPSGKHI